MKTTIDQMTIDFKTELARCKDEAKAEREKEYLKSNCKFYGVTLPEIQKIVIAFRKKNPTLEKDKLFKISVLLWDSRYHEEKMLSVKILEAYSSYLSFKDMVLFETMLNTSDNFALVDEISCHLVSAVLVKNKRAFEYLKKWTSSDSAWLKRAALISQIVLFRNDKGSKELFFDIAEKLSKDEDHFVKKGLAWSLREVSKNDPDAVILFLKENKAGIDTTIIKESCKLLPDSLFKQIAV